ncbi:LamG-like jellyroll fold domain-containing protein [Candidatus Kuenenia sp.]|uniref:LamG-like jellyroll fold domain-containing protein n=1 Tax=Candidatus Kuenenia sp. TaxID=2499824 RepID=UPI003AF49CF0
MQLDLIPVFIKILSDNGVCLGLSINLLLGEIVVKSKISIVVSILVIAHIVLFSEKNFAEEKAYQNIYGTVWNDKPSEDISYARQMGYDSIAINPSSEVKDYHNNPNCTGLNYYLIDPQWYPQILSGYSRTIDSTKPVSEEAKEFYNQRMVWKSHEPFPYNLATGYHPAGSSDQFYVMWDFQQQAVIDEVVENIISLAKSYEDTSLPFTFGGYIIDEPKLAGEFYRLDETGNNISVDLSYWTGADLGLVHDAITHEYATYSEGMAAFYKKLRARISQEFTHPKWIVQPTLLYSEADNDEWIYQIKVRADKDELTPDMLSQKSPQNTNYVDDANNFNAGVDITKDKVGNSQTSEADEYKNRLFAAKAGINGAWYNWFGRYGGTGDMSGFKSIAEVSSQLKLIRCIPNWDNLNNVPLSERSWDGNVYQSTNSYAGSDVMYSRQPKTGKFFAVFLTLSGAVTLNAGETATSVQRTDGYFIESGDGSADVSIIGNEISLKSKDNIGKGYIFTVSADGAWSTVETGSETESDETSGSETSDETLNGSGLTHTTLVEYYPPSGPRNTVSSKKRTKAIISKQSSSSTQTWQQVAKRTQAQKTAGLSGGEGWQMILGITYAPSDPTIAWFCTDTNQVWKSTDGGTSWERKANGFYANGAVSIVIDPTNPNIVYAAGGMMPASSSTAENHIAEGIFRTTDGGDNWTLAKDAHFHRSQAQGGIHFAFAGSTIYAAQSEGGLLKSTNGGTTWNLVSKSGGGYVLDNHGGLFDIKVHPTNNKILFISTGWGLYKVEDSGGSATVTKIGTGLPSHPYATVINYNNPNIMYATANTNGVYKSTDGGLNFTQTKASPVSNGTTGQAQQIAMNPVNPNKVMVGFLRLWPNKQLYYTHDGGTNWTLTQTMDEKNADGWVAGSLFSGGWTQDYSGSGEWAAPVAFHPTIENTALIEGHGDIVRKTTDGGVTWKYSNTGYTGSAGVVNSPSLFGWDRDDPNVLATFHMDFGPMLTEDGEDTFRNIATASPTGAAAGGAIRDNIIVETAGNWTIGTYTVNISRNSGDSFTAISGTTGGKDDWVSRLTSFHPQNDNIVYAGKYRFDNIGTSNAYVAVANSKAVIGMFQGNGDIVYTWGKDGTTGNWYIQKSTDKGNTWSATNLYPSIPVKSGNHIKQIAIDPTNQNRIYAAVRNEGIYIITDTSANGGETIYRGNANGITKSRYGYEDINSVAVDPNNPNVVYAAAYASWYGHSNGIFRSTDYGMTWTNINGNLGSDINIHGISVNPHNGYVYISSFAGTWKLSPPVSTSAADTTAPKCSISINSGDAYTSTMGVILKLSATDNVGVTGYYLSTSSTTPAASATGWVSVTSTTSYTEDVSYTLSSGDGTKTVYVWYKDAAGNVSNTASDAILLDTATNTTGNLQALYAFEEGSGTVASDSSGNNNDGDISGAAWTTGKSGGALSFNGNAYVVKTNPSSGLKPSTEVAIAAWIKTSATDTNGAEVASMGDSYALRVEEDGNIKFFYYNGSKWISTKTIGVNVLNGTWHHIVVQKTSTALQVYVDGVSKASSSSTGTITYTKGNNLFIGRHGNGDTPYDFIGLIDETGIYNRALSDQEIQNLYTNGVN